MKFSKVILFTASALSGLSLSAAAAAQTAMPYDSSDGEWVRVTGDISDVTPQGFSIDYTGGSIVVEMDGFLTDSTRQFRDGDWVTVSGKIDDSLWERRSIEAMSVYSSRLQERFWASAIDEEGDALGFTMIDVPNEGDWLGVTGQVVSVDQAELEMVVDLGSQNLQVDITALGGPVLADPGDRVSVYGTLDDSDFWDAREIDAASVVILQQG